MFRLKNVTRRFGTRVAVDNVTFDIPQGQMVGVIGRSGAGKSTMLRMINRLADPSEGTIHFTDVESSTRDILNLTTVAVVDAIVQEQIEKGEIDPD